MWLHFCEEISISSRSSCEFYRTKNRFFLWKVIFAKILWFELTFKIWWILVLQKDRFFVWILERFPFFFFWLICRGCKMSFKICFVFLVSFIEKSKDKFFVRGKFLFFSKSLMIFKKISIVHDPELYHLQYFSWVQLVDLGRVNPLELDFSEEISIFFLKIFDKHWFTRDFSLVQNF